MWQWDVVFSRFPLVNINLPMLHPHLHLHVALTWRTNGSTWRHSKKQCSCGNGTFLVLKISRNGVLQPARAHFRTSISVGNQNFTAVIPVKLVHWEQVRGVKNASENSKAIQMLYLSTCTPLYLLRQLEVCHPRCVCENWKGYVVKHNYVN